jgi:A/G-specific adenine glycosylase
VVSDAKAERYFVKKILEWGRKNRRAFPWRNDPTPYRVLIAEFFLQRTPAERIATFYPDFIDEYPSIEKLVRADLKKLEPLGLTKRASWLLSTAKKINREYRGIIPAEYQQLITLPGIGRYTASATLCFGYHRDISIVDANVVRILKRYFGVDASSRIGREEIYALADTLIPIGNGVRYNEIILDFTAIICQKKPLCKQCSLIKYCKFYSENLHNVLSLAM